MSNYLLLPPSANVLAGRTVTSVTGTPDSDHPLSWLTDQRPAFPIRYPAGAWKVSISVDTKSVKLIALANHSIDATVTIGGTPSGTIAIPTLPTNGVALNPYKLYATAVPAVTTLTLEGTNVAAMILGEAFAGVPIEITPFYMTDMHDEFFDGGLELQGDYMNVPAFDEAREWRVFGGTQTFFTSEKAALIAAWESQRGGSRPSLLIVDQAVNDARVVQMLRPTFKPKDHPAQWEASLTFVEYPRYRW